MNDLIERIFIRTRSFVGLSKLESLEKHFTHAERIIFYGLVTILCASSFALLSYLNQLFLVEVPRYGGSFSEGVVGSPRFINPLFAISDADRDLTSLIYSGLMKPTPEGGLTPDLAESYKISEDGKVYTFTLKENATFQDGTPITTSDVIFTILKAKDSGIKSPKRANWEGVGVEKISDHEVQFVLKQPYAPFLENTTMGILPKHIWQDAQVEEFPFSEYNIEPIGSGPYKIKSIKRNGSGVPQYYELEAFDNYVAGKPYISKLEMKFFPNEESLINAVENGAVDNINSISPEDAAFLKLNGKEIATSPLPRVFGVFFNQNQNKALSFKEVRSALQMVVNRDQIIDEVLRGYGSKLYSPLPPSTGISATSSTLTTSTSTEASIASAIKLLEKNGWKFDQTTGIYQKTVKKEVTPLSFAISTADIPELKKTAELLAKEWQAIGAKVDVKIFEAGDLQQNVIRPRKYDALLFGQIIGRDLDLFAFWHSSQRNDPGLNIALYANITADKLLEAGRNIADQETRLQKYQLFVNEVAKDIPAIFLYSPNFTYVLNPKIHNVALGTITTPGERFLNINEWYVETQKVWTIFAPTNKIINQPQ